MLGSLIVTLFSIFLNHENGQYAVGDPVVVTAEVPGVNGHTLEMTEYVFGKQVKTVPVGPLSGRDTIFSRTYQEPTAVMLEFRALGKTSVEGSGELEGDSFRIGFVVGASQFAPGNPAPSDVREFWAGEIAGLRQLPMDAISTPVALEARDSLLECFDVCLNGPDGVPVRGYYARPRGAEAGSCAIVINFHAAGVSGNWCRSKVKDALRFACKGAICFDFNALGMKNDQDEDYYKALEEGPLYKYSDSPLVDRATYFFKNMILRAVRGLDYACSDSLWNGRTVLLLGESQGGYQASMLAGLDSRVSDVIVRVPAGVGTGGSRVGRCNSWPKVLEDSDFSQYSIDNAPYFDGAVLLQGCKADFVVEIGLIDTTCPPSEVFSGFNTVAGNVRFLTFPYRPHHAHKIPSQYGKLWKDNIQDVCTGIQDSIIAK